MIGLMERAFLEALSRRWDTTCTDATKWRRMFPDATDITKLRDVWRSALTVPAKYDGAATKYVQFALSEQAHRDSELPVVLLRQSAGQVTASASGSVEGEEYINSSYTVEVIVIATQDELAMALGTFARNALNTERTRLIDRTGCSGLNYLSYQKIAPMLDLLPERGGHAWYRLQYRANVDETHVDLDWVANQTAKVVEIHDLSADDGAGHIGRAYPILTEDA